MNDLQRIVCEWCKGQNLTAAKACVFCGAPLDISVGMQLHFEHPAGTWRAWRSWGNRYVWLRLWGPGRVAIQSAYELFEDPGRDLVNHSSATRRQWS